MNTKYSVLVVDDQNNWRELLSDILADQFKVKSAESYEKALELIRDQRPPFHVVVTDMRLKDEEAGNEDGLKLIEYLNKLGDETSSVVITGYATVRTAKWALSHLEAYDYLEKHLSDGSAFDDQAFHQIVYQAALKAEEKRPQGFSVISRNILLIDPDPARCIVIKDILRKDDYQLTVLQTSENLETHLRETDQNYSLVLVNENLSSAELLSNLHRAFSDVQTIILTSKDVSGIVGAMREFPVLTAFSMPDGRINKAEFRELIHSALSVKAKKYISIMTSSNYPDQAASNDANLVVGMPCKISLSIQDAPTQDALLVTLLPSETKRKKIRLHLFVHAENMKVEPASEMYWEIPLSEERPERLVFSITPLKSGKNILTIEIEQSQGWLGRVSKKIHVLD